MIKCIITTAEISDSSAIDSWEFSFRLYTFPLIRKELSFDSEVEQLIFQRGRERINAIFTSEVAVRSVFERLEQQPDWNIYCLNGKTRTTLLKFIPETLIAAMGRNSSELSVIIKEDPEPLRERPTVFFCGNRRMPMLPMTFQQLGIPLEEIISYNTSCAPSTIGGDIHGFLFFSPSAVDCFFTHNPQVSDKSVLFAIGETTAESIKAHCTNKIIIAPEPSEAALLNEVKIYFEALKKLEK